MSALKKWGHMRSAPFAEIADLLEQQDEALARSSANLQEGTKKLIEAATLCRAADARIAQLLAVLEAVRKELKNNPPKNESGEVIRDLVNAALSKAAR